VQSRVGLPLHNHIPRAATSVTVARPEYTMEKLSVSKKAFVEVSMRAEVADELDVDLYISTMVELKTNTVRCIKKVAAAVRQPAECAQAELAEVSQIYEDAARRLSGVLRMQKEIQTRQKKASVVAVRLISTVR
jgi:hypothetical protein